MATSTTKWSLRKPAGTDNVNVVTDIADNMQKIDDGAVALQTTIDGHTTSIGTLTAKDTSLQNELDASQVDIANSQAAITTLQGRDGLSYRNVIRNGDMSIWQRGVGPTSNFNGVLPLLADGWILGGNGGTPTHNRVTNAVGTPAKYSYRIGIAGQSAVDHYAAFSHKIEGVHTFSGKQVTLSFTAVATAGAPKIALEIQQNFGTGGSAGVLTAISAVTISTTPTRYSITFTVPSIAGKTVGTANNDDCLLVGLWLSAGSNFAARASSIGIQNATIDITDVQLEEGAIATPFERLPQQVQLAWCQRYYFKSDTSVATGVITTGFVQLSSQAAGTLRWPVIMRAVPTVTFGPGGWAVAWAATSTPSSSAVSATNLSTGGCAIVVPTGAGSLTVGHGCHVYSPASNGYIEASAELP